MKLKAGFLFAILSLSVNTLDAQMSIKLIGDNTNYASSTYYISATDGNEHVLDFLVRNEGTIAREWFITRKQIIAPGGWVDYFCWGTEHDPFGGNCYPADLMNTNPWTSTHSVIAEPDSAGLLIIHINPENYISTTGHYRYYIGRTSTDYQDSVDIEIATDLAIDEFQGNENSVLTYPNPANELLHVNLNLGQQVVSVFLTDLQGKVVLEKELSGSGTIDVSELCDGVYVLSLQSQGVLQKRRIVIQH